MTAQIGDSYFFDGDAYVIVDESVEKELFSPANYGLNPTSLLTACWNGYWCNYEISDALYLQNLFIHCGDKDYPDICGRKVNTPLIFDRKKQRVESMLFGDDGYRTYENMNMKIPFSGTILVGSGFIHRYYIHMGYQKAHAYKKLLEFEFEKGNLISVVDLSQNAREKRKKLEEMGCNNFRHRPNIFSNFDNSLSREQDDKASMRNGINKRHRIFPDYPGILEKSTMEEKKLGCRNIGSAMNSVAVAVLDLYEHNQITKEVAMRLLRTCRRGVYFCDGNEDEAIKSVIHSGYCGLCFEKNQELSNVFVNDLEYPDKYDVFNTYDEAAVHNWLCPECLQHVLEEYQKTKK